MRSSVAFEWVFVSICGYRVSKWLVECFMFSWAFSWGLVEDSGFAVEHGKWDIWGLMSRTSLYWTGLSEKLQFGTRLFGNVVDISEHIHSPYMSPL